ncbi:MAG: hypothetical protein AB1640_02405 [bacterium]
MAIHRQALVGMEFVQRVLDSMPLVMFLVDQDFVIADLNAAAAEFVRTNKEGVRQQRGGTVLECLHAVEADSGCGRSESCKSCIIHEAVQAAIRGQRVERKHARLLSRKNGEILEAHYLATACPFVHEGKPFALLMLEDVSDLIRLQSFLPICAGCKKIRDRQNRWHNLESYLESRIDVEFTHGMCPECLEKWYPGEE